MEQEQTIEVNGRKMSIKDFQIFQENLLKSKDIQLVETAPNCYKTRLFG